MEGPDAGPIQPRDVFSAQPANAVLVRKRAESSALFAMLSGRHVENALHLPENDRIKAAAHFVVGGVDICARVDPNAGAEAGRSMRLMADLANMHLIDEASGQVL